MQTDTLAPEVIPADCQSNRFTLQIFSIKTGQMAKDSRVNFKNFLAVDTPTKYASPISTITD
jgi:hypothetical protein